MDYAQDIQTVTEQLLAEISPEKLQQIEQLLAEENASSGEPLRETVQNILDESIPAEEQERLRKRLRPQRFRPKAPPREGKGVGKKKNLGEFDPFPAKKPRKPTEYQKLLQWLNREP